MHNRFKTYRRIVKGIQPFKAQSLRSHWLHWWLMHCIIGGIGAIGVLVWVGYEVSDTRLETLQTKFVASAQTLYPEELLVSYSSSGGFMTNMSGPVILTVTQFADLFTQDAGIDPLNAGPTNFLVLDPSGTVELFPSYNTLFLITNTLLIARSANEIKIVPLQTQEGIEGFTLNKTDVDEMIQGVSSWIDTNKTTIRLWLVVGIGLSAILLLPVIAFFLTLRVTLGMQIVTLICRLLSKIWVNVHYEYLFTGLSYLYMPVYLLLHIFAFVLFIPYNPLWGFLLMVACLSLFIIRAEEKKKI